MSAAAGVDVNGLASELGVSPERAASALDKHAVDGAIDAADEAHESNTREFMDRETLGGRDDLRKTTFYASDKMLSIAKALLPHGGLSQLWRLSLDRFVTRAVAEMTGENPDALTEQQISDHYEREFSAQADDAAEREQDAREEKEECADAADAARQYKQEKARTDDRYTTMLRKMATEAHEQGTHFDKGHQLVKLAAETGDVDVSTVHADLIEQYDVPEEKTKQKWAKHAETIQPNESLKSLSGTGSTNTGRTSTGENTSGTRRGTERNGDTNGGDDAHHENRLR